MKRATDYMDRWKGSRLGKLIQGHPRRSEAIIVSLFFGLLAALFMGPILWHFGSAVHGFWGDGTGGLIWLNSLELGPFGGITDAVIYPYGDNLFRPEFITAALFVLPFWLLTQVIGAVAAWNVIIFVSFWLCGVSMYYLAKRLTHSPLAAAWAGVAFMFLPMHQYKAFGHIAYVMTFVFVFVLWQVLNFAQKPSKKHSILLGLAFAAPFYVDGYYVLFTLLLVGVPLAYLLLFKLWRLSKKTAEDFRAFLGNLLIFAGTAFVALLPVAYTKLVYGAQISSNLALARGDFFSNVMVYTARWYDFVIPIETHPFFGEFARNFRMSHNHGSNVSEHTLYVGFVVLALVGWTLYYLWQKRRQRRVKELPTRRQTLLILLLVAIVALALSLPPFLHIMGYRIPLPSGVLSALVQYWRVYARLILIIHLVLVLVGAVGLAILLKRFKHRACAWAVALLLIAVTFFEYLSFNPFKRQDIWYYNKLSSANQWLVEHTDVKVIAVYPLVDQPDGLASLYTTEQRVHGKKMINSGTISAKQARLRASISGLDDPQTLPVLKALGAQVVMTHEIPNDRQVQGLRLAYGANEAPAGYASDVDLFRITDSVAAAQAALVADEGFKDVREINLKTKYYVAGEQGVSLKVLLLPTASSKPDKQRQVHFDIHAKDNYAGNDLIVMQGDKVLETISINAGAAVSKTYWVSANEPIRLLPVGKLQPDSLYLENLRSVNE